MNIHVLPFFSQVGKCSLWPSDLQVKDTIAKHFMIQDSHYLNILPIRDSTSRSQCDPREGLEEEE